MAGNSIERPTKPGAIGRPTGVLETRMVVGGVVVGGMVVAARAPAVGPSVIAAAASTATAKTVVIRRTRWALFQRTPTRGASSPHDVQGGRFAEDESADVGWAVRIGPQARQSCQDRLERRGGLEPGEMHPHAHVRAVGEGEVAAARRGARQASRIEAVGVGKHGGIPVRGADRYANEFAVPDA